MPKVVEIGGRPVGEGHPVYVIERVDPPCYKMASASLTDDALLKHTVATGKPMILSTGMSSLAEVEKAVSYFDIDKLIVLHATSTYPCKPEELNLRVIPA